MRNSEQILFQNSEPAINKIFGNFGSNGDLTPIRRLSPTRQVRPSVQQSIYPVQDQQSITNVKQSISPYQESISPIKESMSPQSNVKNIGQEKKNTQLSTTSQNFEPNDEMTAIRKILKLDTDIWKNLPNDLIETAFRPPSVIIKKDVKKKLMDQYKLSDLETLEFLGDAVLELAATQIIFEEFIGTPGKMTVKRQELVRNTALFCLMSRLNLCQYSARKNKPYKIKDCADILEAVLGALYYYLSVMQKNKEAMAIMIDYIKDVLYDSTVRKNLFERNIPIDLCQVDGQYQNAFELGKDHIIYPKQRDFTTYTSPFKYSQNTQQYKPSNYQSPFVNRQFLSKIPQTFDNERVIFVPKK